MDIALVALLTLVASAVGAITGFGTSTIMVPVLVAFLPLVAGSSLGRLASGGLLRSRSWPFGHGAGVGAAP